jgi:hypothetical protein
MPKKGKQQRSGGRQAPSAASSHVSQKTWEPAADAIAKAAQLADLQQQWLQDLQDTISKPDSKLYVSGEFFASTCALTGKLWQLLVQEEPSKLLQQVRHHAVARVCHPCVLMRS